MAAKLARPEAEEEAFIGAADGEGNRVARVAAASASGAEERRGNENSHEAHARGRQGCGGRRARNNEKKAFADVEIFGALFPIHFLHTNIS